MQGHGFQIDFQRDIRKNDSFQIVYETYVDENGEIFENGNILYANLVLSENTINYNILKKKQRPL